MREPPGLSQEAKGRSEEFRLVLSGAAPDTDNLGVSALCWSAVTGVLSRHPDCLLTVLDFGRGTREEAIIVNGKQHSIARSGASHTRRVYKAESLRRIRLSARLGGFGNAAARAFRQTDAVLDVSGGDSFTDLYGRWRFRSIVLPKLITLESRRPLILLPQTYGPFNDPANRRVAEKVLRGVDAAWARDKRSLDVLAELLGDDFDPERHRSGVDLAFGLEPRRPKDLALPLDSWLENDEEPLVGINVSGLIYRDPEAARERYGFRADYREAIHSLIDWFLRETAARLVLVPHVVSPPDHYESDVGAINDVVEAHATTAPGRIVTAPIITDPAEVKWLISKLDWLCGTRMHATIAALSTGVPATAIAYSDKTLGVFEMFGLGDHVVDPRRLDTAEVIDATRESWIRRHDARRDLNARLPAVLEMARDQMDEVMSRLDGTADGRGV